MKNLLTVHVIILCLTCVFQSPIAEAADMCIEADDSGYLDSKYIGQKETPWCWVASANAATNYFGMTDETIPNTSYTQCRLYNIAKAPNVDCCDDSSSQNCQRTGWPWEVFERLNPQIDYTGEWNPMDWSQIRNQICPKWSPGRPFIFIARPHSGGLAHTHIIKGFGRSAEGFPQLLIDDHYDPVGPRFIDYECKYKLPENCQRPNTRWDRVGDLYDLHPLQANTP